MKYHFFLFFVLTCCFSFSQKKYPKNYFSPPMDIPIVVAGTFGELRSNHFHSGIDLKTQKREGIPIRAAADGYISRIKIRQYGYGKALYIDHPNGYTTVYAHLQRFSSEVQQFVKDIQYKKEQNNVGNIFPKINQFKVKKGEIIAYSGDTGSSSAPHLHYEIRNTKTENIINPLLFGLKAEDTKKPIIKGLKVFALDNSARINNSNNNTIIPIKQLENGNYVSERINANGNIGLGIHVYDHQNAAMNKNGIYSLEMNVNGKRVYYHDVETFSFAESKYINLLIDYEHYKKYKKRFQKTHKVHNNKLSLYEGLENNGKITVNAYENYNVEIIAKDYNGNATALRIPIKGIPANTMFSQKDTTNYKITSKEFHKFEIENVTVAFPKNTFYHDCFIDFSVKDEIAKLHEPTIPLDKKFTLTFHTEKLTDVQKEQVYIANVTKEKYPYYVTTKRRENKVFTNQKTLGSYTLLFDDKNPEITLLNFAEGRWLTKNKTLKVKIEDNESGINEYRATIDNEWILMEYNHKKGILTYDFSDKKLVGSKHIFKLVVSDNVGNTETISTTFYRK
ncbi:M23 family metallopeptidase [Tenacibaculum sp. MEBiC06402]|uniref:M23 family metallopeptidase n=1 Tax=unclassified Tenacibaculum TaxID=2635139 RepID=UPI003B9BB3DF